MWPWIKRWRDWVIHDVWPLSRTGPRPQAMHYSYEKAGVVVDGQPIPWNAEAVLAEALLRLPGSTLRTRADFTLRLPGRDPVPAEDLRADETPECIRVFFRFSPPGETVAAELLWREQPLTRLTLPRLSREEFLRGLRLQMPTLAVCLGEQTVACQTFVATQSRGLIASALLSAPTSLAPVADLDMHIEFQPEPAGAALRVPVRLTSSQLRGKQALVAVTPSRLPRRSGAWVARWILEGQELAAQRVRAISKVKFLRSLRVSETRYVIQDAAGHLGLTRQVPPRDGPRRVGPCFLVSSSEAGMAALCTLQVRALVTGGVQAPLLQEQEVLITDGPTPVAPGTVDADDLLQMTGFDLRVGNRSLGILPLSPAPSATFTSEGGYKPPMEYTWSAAAEDELAERLSRLMNGRANGKG